MTENNYNKLIDAICELVNLAWDSTSKEEFERLDNAGADIIDCLEEIQQYRAIGTIEEFKALKEKEERFDRNIKMFNEIGLEIRTNAIDEFVDRLEKYEQENWVNHLEYGINWSDIEHIVQEMKAGGTICK